MDMIYLKSGPALKLNSTSKVTLTRDSHRMMQTIRFITFSLIFFLFIGCRTDIVISESRHFPKEPNFTIIPSENIKEGVLDFDSVYYNQYETQRKDKTYLSYNYYRFWPNGRVLLDYSTHLPSREEAEDFTQAYIGYYQISDKNIEIELFVPSTGIWEWDYISVYGHIEDNRIVESRDEMGGIVMNATFIFQKHYIGGLKRQPDW